MRPASVGGPTYGDRGAAPPPLSSEAHGWKSALVGLAATLQVIIMALTFLSVMLWAGLFHAVATVVAILGLVLMLVVGTRTGRPTAVIALLAVPFASVGLILGLAYSNEWWLARSACSDRELEAVNGLKSPTGERLTFEGTSEGCVAAVDSDKTTEGLTATFGATLRNAGWTIIQPDGGRMAQKGGVTLFVEGLTEFDGGIQISVNDDPEN